jgi:diguanylate cyclase (GGDEF)-like protein/PAS domain S-box-containing protein
MNSNRDFSEMFVQSLEQAIDGVVVIDDDNRIIFFNAAAEKLWGYSKKEVLGQLFTILQPENNPYSAPSMIMGALKTIPIAFKNGEQRWGSVSVSKVKSGEEIFYTVFIKDVTAEHLAEERTRMLSLAADQTDNAIIITNGKWEIVYANASFTRMFGYSFEEIKGLHPISLLAPNTDKALIAGISKRLRNGLAFNTEELTYVSGGERMWCNVTTNPIFDADSSLINTVSVLTDITHAKKYEVLQHQVLEAMTRDIPLIEVLDVLCREIQRINPECIISILRVDDAGILHPLVAPRLLDQLSKAITGIKIGEGTGSCGTAAFRGEEVIVHDIENDPLWDGFRELVSPLGLNSCWSIPIKTGQNRVVATLAFYHKSHYVPTAYDRQLVNIIVPLCALALEREESRSHIRQLAFYDRLTTLPNRHLIYADAERALQDAKHQQTSLAVVFIDVDRFKLVNDTLGNPAGDALLKIMADRLKQGRRHADIVGRLSGDEFVLILPGYDSLKVKESIDALRLNLHQMCVIGNETMLPSVSIGISIFPQDGQDIDTLFHRADKAMQQAKMGGLGRYSFFSHEMNQLFEERQALETDLRNALLRGELEQHYQPQVYLIEGGLYGVEALARWPHPELGFIPPSKFVAIAEECGLINELGLWAIRQACMQLAEWRSKGIDVPMVAVNLSPTNFHDPDLPEIIALMLHEHGLTTRDLTIEITENILVDTNPCIITTLDAIHKMGIRLSMDDFGTGYSSLSYLRRLPIHELKLDRSFVNDLGNDQTSQTLSNAIMRIGESLDLTVVAEGIETQHQHMILKKQGYHVAQGYLYSKPLSAADFELWLAQNQQFIGQRKRFAVKNNLFTLIGDNCR